MGFLFVKHPPLKPLAQTEEAKKDKHADISFPSQLFWRDRVVQVDVIVFIIASIILRVGILAWWGYSPLQRCPPLEGCYIVWQLPQSLFQGVFRRTVRDDKG